MTTLRPIAPTAAPAPNASTVPNRLPATEPSRNTSPADDPVRNTPPQRTNQTPGGIDAPGSSPGVRCR